jgi:hypothetical protein
MEQLLGALFGPRVVGGLAGDGDEPDLVLVVGGHSVDDG